MQRTPPLGLKGTFAIFGGFAILLVLVCHDLIPRFAQLSGMEPIFWWFVLAGIGVFFPLIVFAYVLLNREGAFTRPGFWTDRMRFRKLNRDDWFWAFGGLVAVGVLSGLIMAVTKILYPAFSAHSSFMSMEPLSSGRYWLLFVWVLYWFFNMMGEEILWRGVILPRQEVTFGKNAWLVNSAGWALFHVAFGWQLLIILIPILIIQPYVVQRRRNSWIGVIIHAGLNGPAFLCIAFGII